MSNKTLTVKHTADRFGQPLACLQDMPGEGAEFRAANLRRLARGLEMIADECDRGAGLVYPETITHELDQAANPFTTYRSEIRGGYSTAQRLAALVKHLYNGGAHPVRLDNLLSNADEYHTRIALELIRWYADHRENCPEFMRLARELVERDHPTTDDE